MLGEDEVMEVEAQGGQKSRPRQRPAAHNRSDSYCLLSLGGHGSWP